MKRIQFFLIVILTLSLVFTPRQVEAVGPSDGRYQTQELIVSLKPDVVARMDMLALSPSNLGTSSLNQLAAKFDVQSARKVFDSASPADPLTAKYNLHGTLILEVGPGVDLHAMRNAFLANPAIDFAELNLRVYASVIPEDPRFAKQWSLHNADDHDIDAPQAWNVTKGKKSVMIAVVDTGILYTHPDLRGRVRTDIDKDFADNDDDALDDHGHGTHVAGIIGAATNNGKGMSGICWNCTILPVRVLNAQGSGTADGVAQGIQYAADQHAEIISMSLGIDPACGCSKTIAQALNYAYEKGSLLIAASGNNGVNGISYPASSSRVIAVGATNRNDKRTSWSNYGKGLDLVAPGNKIVSTWLNNEYAVHSGTSMATPHVSGVAGLIWSRNLKLTNAQVWWVLNHAVDDLGVKGKDPTTGFGRLNANKAVRVKINGRIKAPVDNCDREPESGCGSCSTQVALSDDPFASQDLALLHAFRDQVLSQSARGRQWTEVFYRHTFEVSGLLASDPDLRRQAMAVLADAMPGIRRLVDGGQGEAVIVTSDQIKALSHFKAALVMRGSSELAADLEREWSAVSPGQYTGQDVITVWKSLTK